MSVDEYGYSYATKDDIRNPDWSLVTRRARFSRCTVADLLGWCEERGQDPSSVEVSGGHVAFREIESEQERSKRLDAIAESDARQQQWERDTYARLHAKFGGVSGSPTSCDLGARTHVDEEGRCHHDTGLWHNVAPRDSKTARSE